ncbi:unnamed protein product, partial [Rotaria magnacalcarata]
MWARSIRNTSALLVMLGHYSGEHDDIEEELRASISQQRWRYSWASMIERTR